MPVYATVNSSNAPISSPGAVQRAFIWRDSCAELGFGGQKLTDAAEGGPWLPVVTKNHRTKCCCLPEYPTLA